MLIFSKIIPFFMRCVFFICCFVVLCCGMLCHGISVDFHRFSMGSIRLVCANDVQEIDIAKSSGILPDTLIKIYKKMPIETLIKKADTGDAIAQCALGILYDDGENGLTQNFEKAQFYYALSANQNFAPAQFCIGFDYYKGVGVKQNYKQAFYFYTLAAEQNYARAQNNLAFLYLYGDGTSQNFEKAAYYAKLASKELGFRPYLLFLLAKICFLYIQFKAIFL